MIQYKRANITKLAQQKNVPYYTLDVLRQTTIKRLVDDCGKLSKKELKTYILTFVSFLLDNMVVEK